MNSELLWAFGQFMIVLIIFGSIPIFLASEEIKNNYLKNKMMKKISKIKDDGEFDYIYKQIRNSSEMEEVKKECRDNFRNFVCGTFCGVWAIIFLISPIFLGENFVILSTLLFLIFLIISVIFFNTSPNNKYKENVAKKLILATDPNIKYIDYLAWPSIVTELYSMAGYNDSASNRRYGTDYMEYTITRDVLVKLANLDLQCESHIRMGLGRGSRNRVKIFEGICAKIERNGNFTNNILYFKCLFAGNFKFF